MEIRRGIILMGFVLVAGQTLAAQEPRDDSYTGLAAAHIQQAEAEPDSAAAAESYERGLQLALDGIQANGNSKSYFLAGVAYLGLRRYAAADSAFDKAEEMWEEYRADAALYRENGWINAYNSAMGSLDAGDSQTAIEMLHEANMVYDFRPEGYLNLGSTYARLGETEMAIDSYRNAIDRIERPEAMERDEATQTNWARYKQLARVNISQILLGLDRAEEAVPILELVLEEDPDNLDARNNLAIAKAALGEVGDAVGIYDEILEAPASSPIDLYNAGVGLYQAEDYAKAVRAFAAALDKSPRFLDALQNLTQALAQAARTDEALWAEMPQYSSRLLEMSPRNEMAYQLHGIALARAGDSDTAVALDEERRALSFVMEQLQMQPAGDGVRIVGSVLNRTLEEGTAIRMRFTFYDSSGSQVGSSEIEIDAPAQEMMEVFTFEFSGEGAAAGYSYEVIES